MNDEYFMNQAIALAKEAAEEGEVPVGAVVVLDGKIVGAGRNRREISKNALAHAEIEAINEACRALGGWRLWQCDMYVTLEPCPMCTGAIINSRSGSFTAHLIIKQVHAAALLIFSRFPIITNLRLSRELCRRNVRLCSRISLKNSEKNNSCQNLSFHV